MLAQFNQLKWMSTRTLASRLITLTFMTLGLWVSAGHAQANAQQSSFTARLVNLENTTKDPFRFYANLYNAKKAKVNYALKAELPQGWTVAFKVDGSQVSAIQMDSLGRRDIAIEIHSTPFASPGSYKIPVRAIAENDTLSLDLEAVISGHHQLELSTPSGRLSDAITEGKSKKIVLSIKNNGTLPLEGLDLSSQTPSQWNAVFEPSRIDRLEPNQNQEVTVTLSVPDKTIAGDYLSTFTVKNAQVSAQATFRMTVKTSILSGWIGLLVIAGAIGLVFYLIRKYGRR